MVDDPSPANAIPGSVLPDPVGAATSSEPITQQESLAQLISCSHCGQTCPVGTLICPGCNAVIDARVDPLAPEATYDLSAQLTGKSPRAEGPLKIGTAPLLPATILLDVAGTRVILPLADVVIVGRSSEMTTTEPGIDLSPFGAVEKGVSRRHARIIRKGTMAYVTDIGSANGTWLNGQRLIAHGERLLRNGDELQLGLLKLTVNYESTHR